MNKFPKKKTDDPQLEELAEDLKRAQADFINLKRRTEQERISVARIAKQDVIVQLLPVLDNIERALGHRPDELKENDWANGIAKVAEQLEAKLRELGVSKIPTVGEDFDPNLHEAVAAEGEGEHEIISEELQAGYVLGDEVVRHAIVKVKRK